MIGIIYKFTILTNGRFYVGQHEDKSIDNFMISKPSLSNCYWGSGSAIWEHVLRKLMNKYPNCWNKLIKREILFHSKCDSFVLNKMERYFIKREKAHYSYNLGGCNFLWGEANGDDWVNAMKFPDIRRKASLGISKALKGKYIGKNSPFYGKHRTKEVREKISKTRRERGYKMDEKAKEKILIYIRKPKSEEHRKKIGDAQRGEKSVHWGKHLSDEHKNKVSKSLKEKYRANGSKLSGRKWITNGVENKWHDPKLPIPKGWKYGRTNKR